MSPQHDRRLASEFADRVCAQWAEQFRELCRAAGVSQYKLWQRSGVSRDMLSRVAAGKCCPGLHVMARIAYALGIQEADLLKAFLASAKPDLDQKSAPHA